MAQKRKARELTVVSAIQLTLNMRRITLHGEDLASFPEDADGAYFKLTFSGDDPEKPIMRTYTVAQHRPDRHEIDVDFMLHTSADGSSDGVAATWAINAQPGGSMSIFGPGPATFINPDAQWYLLAADMTALPALAANLSRLPPNARGYIVIEILAEEDEQELSHPAGMNLIWVINPEPGSDDSPLNKAIRNLEWLAGQVAVWAACEFKTMKKLRHYFRDEHSVESSHVYISSYWKKGLQEEEHKIVKKEDAS